MTARKLSLCFVLLGFLGMCSAVSVQRQTYQIQTGRPIPAGPRVSIEKVNNMSPSMQLDANDFLKRAYSLHNMSDRVNIFRQLFSEKYPEHTWHVAIYKSYSVVPLKSITLKVDNTDTFVLFATKK